MGNAALLFFSNFIFITIVWNFKQYFKIVRYNLHKMYIIFKGTAWWVLANVYTYGASSTVQIQNMFITPEGPLVPHLSSYSSFPSIHNLLSINGVIQYILRSGFICLAMFLRFLYVVAYINYSFYYWLIFHCVDIPQFVYLFTCWWTFEMFPVWDYSESSCFEYSFTSLCEDMRFYISRSWIASSCYKLCLTL